MRILQTFRSSEPDAHLLMRRARKVLLVLLIAVTIAAVVSFSYFKPAFYLTMLTLPLLFLAFVYTCYLERQSRTMMLRTTDQLDISQEELAMNIQYAGIYTLMTILLVFSVATLTMAAVMVKDWATVGLVALVMFSLSSVMLFPYIPLFLAGAEQDQEDKQVRDHSERDEQKRADRENSQD